MYVIIMLDGVADDQYHTFLRRVAEIDPNNRTNRIPTDAELPKLRSLTVIKDEIMKEVQERIHEAEKIRDAAIRHCQMLREEVRQLPVTILCDYFYARFS
jgi:hypothetical protein